MKSRISGENWSGLFDRSKLLENDTIYRVLVCPETNTYSVVCIGTECVDSPLKESYSSLDDMPDWFSRKLAMLCTMEPAGSGNRPIMPKLTNEGFPIITKPWNLKEPQVKGVGTRESVKCFWVVPD